MTSSTKLTAAGLLSAILIAGCAYLPFIHRIKAYQRDGEGPSRILAYYVVHNAPDHLALSVKYFYDGKEGEAVSIGAITLTNGMSNGYWAYRSDPVFKGEHWAHVLIGSSQSAPAAYDSDEIQFSLYINGRHEFVHATVPFRKHWRRLETPSRCHAEWGRGCGK